VQSKGLAAEQIDSSTLERYVRCLRKSGKLRNGDAAALGRLWRMLRPGEVQTPSSPPSACDIVLRQFQLYLRQERGLAEATIAYYAPVVRAFLAECFPTEIPDFGRLCASAIADFVQRQAQRTTTKHASNAVAALRSFFRHLLHRGAIDTDLAACVPTIATWSLSNVPRFLPAEQIQRVLSSCDQNTAIGKRNYAILLLMARLGLRAGEVVALTLEGSGLGSRPDHGAGQMQARDTNAPAFRSRRGDRRLSAPSQTALFLSPCLHPGQSTIGRFRQLRRNLLAGGSRTAKSGR
jgi:site-specific recombinase XerC